MSYVWIGLFVFVGFFLIGYILISIPGIKAKLKKDNIGFSDKEMSEVSDWRKKKFASTNESYTKQKEYFKD